MVYEASIIQGEHRISTRVGKKDSLVAWIHVRLQHHEQESGDTALGEDVFGELRCLNNRDEKPLIYRANPQFG